jgi:hypothetical protein
MVLLAAALANTFTLLGLSASALGLMMRSITQNLKRIHRGVSAFVLLRTCSKASGAEDRIMAKARSCGWMLVLSSCPQATTPPFHAHAYPPVGRASTPCVLHGCTSIRPSSVETGEVHFASSNDHDHEQNTWQLTNNHLADLFKSPENHISFFEEKKKIT